MLDDARRAALEHWLRNEIDASPGKLLGQGYQAAVHVHQSPVGAIVIKQAHETALHGLLTRRSLRHEHAVYERLEGIAGIPRCYGLIDGRYLALEYIDGCSFRHYDLAPERRDGFFDRLLETLRSMHRAGVAHGDLKRKDNLLVGPDERPYVIDFGIACLRAETAPFWNRWLFELLRQTDYNAWIKLKYGRDARELATEDAPLYRPLWIERVARGVRIPWQKVTLRRLRKRARNRGAGPREDNRR